VLLAAIWLLFWGGLGGDGVPCAQGIDEGGDGIHGHGDAECLGDFFFGSASLDGRVRVEGDAAVAVRGDRNSKEMSWRIFSPRRELAELAAESVWYPLRESGESFANCGMVLLSSD
jgi:hypothetical protein